MSVLKPIKATVKHLFEDPLTVRYPKERKEISPRYRGFHINDIEKCIGCGDCRDVCPTNAIELVPVEGIEEEPGRKNLRPVFDYGRCCFCGLCVDVCSTGSLSMSKEFILVSESPSDYRFLADKTRFKDYGWRTTNEETLLHLERNQVRTLNLEERVSSFSEVLLGFDEETVKREAMRCLECGLCMDNCPAEMKIPDYIRAVWEGNLRKAVSIMLKDNPFSYTCGEICTHKCEEICALSNRGEPVAIQYIKHYAMRNYDSVSVIRKAQRKRKEKIAVVGAGPSGLSAAYFLANMGYSVDVYEKEDRLGGVLRYGVPPYRLPDDVLDKDINNILSVGNIKVKTGIHVGRDITVEELLKKYSAVYLAFGMFLPYKVGMANEDNPSIVQALNFLHEVNSGKYPRVGRKVIVIGGGNVAMDAARTALRLQIQQHGEADVTVISLEARDEMPAWDYEIEEAKEEGVRFLHRWGVPKGEVGAIVEDGTLKALKVYRVTQVFDAAGRFNPMFDTKVSRIVETDYIIEAVGQGTDYRAVLGDLFDSLRREGRRIVTDSNQMTSVPGLFIGGDIYNRRRDAVSAVGDGKRAAKGIDRYLRSMAKRK